jgi:hypothetical protein
MTNYRRVFVLQREILNVTYIPHILFELLCTLLKT